MTKKDEPFVAASWFESYWRNVMHNLVQRETYREGQDRVINEILRRRTTRVLVAFAPHEVDHILGYAVLEPPGKLHYIYVKSTYRRMGVATGLMPNTLQEYTHTSDKRGLAFLNLHQLQFNPYGAMP